MNCKKFIFITLLCFSGAAYSQDCGDLLRRASEFASEGRFCDALDFYRRYAACDADADVSTQIAMNERRCRQERESEGDRNQTFIQPSEDYSSLTSAREKVRFGIRAGANFTNFGGEMTEHMSALMNVLFAGMNNNLNAKLKPGFQAGIALHVPLISKKLSFQPSVVYSQQGAKWVNSGSQRVFTGAELRYDLDVEMTLNYIQAPLNLIYRHDLSNNFALLLQAGPYIGYGINGKMNVDMDMTLSINGVSRSDSDSDEEDITFGSDEMFDFLDVGIGFGAGLLISEKLYLNMGYNLGTIDIAEDMSVKNRGFAVTLTYLFGKR